LALQAGFKYLKTEEVTFNNRHPVVFFLIIFPACPQYDNSGVRPMLNGIILAIIVLFLIIISIRERIRQARYREKDWSVIGESKPSPLSQALANLVGVAGGIYLTLVVVITFIELELPERIHLGGISMEPLAAISFLLAIIQPYMQRIINAWRRI
jgi:uncharacterized membrane protein YjgN (DUF898 family)